MGQFIRIESKIVISAWLLLVETYFHELVACLYVSLLVYIVIKRRKLLGREESFTKSLFFISMIM